MVSSIVDGHSGEAAAEEMSRQALKTATALLPAVKLNAPKAGQKKIDVYKVGS